MTKDFYCTEYLTAYEQGDLFYAEQCLRAYQDIILEELKETPYLFVDKKLMKYPLIILN